MQTMRTRLSVLTLSELTQLNHLLSYKHVAPVTHLNATHTKTPCKCCKQGTYYIANSSRCKTYKKQGVGASRNNCLPTAYSLSDCCTLFRTREKDNSFIFKQFRTLCRKHPGGGARAASHLFQSQIPALPGLPTSSASFFNGSRDTDGQPRFPAGSILWVAL